MNLQDLLNKALIGAWVAPPPKNFEGLNNDDFITLEQYKKIKDSGINVIYGLYENAARNVNDVLRALDLSNEVGIKYLVRDSRLMKSKDKKEFLEYLKDYNYKESYLGVLLIDEPGLNDYEQIGKLYSYFKDEFPDKLFYTNLLPLHAESHQFIHGNFGNLEEKGIVSYNKYYDLYFEKCKLPYLSYDLYPFENEYPRIRSDYFKQHQLMLDYSKKYNVPILNFIQTCSFSKHVRIPTKNEILWHVNTSLAYGVKGVQYFTYFYPIETTHEVFNGCMIDELGNETKIYYYVKEINEKIKDILISLSDKELLGIITSKEMFYDIPLDSTYNDQLFDEIVGDDLLIGVFEDKNDLMLYVVNTNLKEEEKNSFKLELNENYVFSKTDSKIKTFSLGCGDGILLHIEKRRK